MSLTSSSMMSEHLGAAPNGALPPANGSMGLSLSSGTTTATRQHRKQRFQPSELATLKQNRSGVGKNFEESIIGPCIRLLEEHNLLDLATLQDTARAAELFDKYQVWQKTACGDYVGNVAVEYTLRTRDRRNRNRGELHGAGQRRRRESESEGEDHMSSSSSEFSSDDEE